MILQWKNISKYDQVPRSNFNERNAYEGPSYPEDAGK